MRYTFLALFGLPLLFATSCNKNDSDSPLSNRLDSVFTRKVSDNTILGGVKYKYDNTGNLVQYFVNNVLATQFKYDSQNRLISISGDATATDTLIYAAGSRTVHMYERTVGTNTSLLLHALVYDGSSRLIFDSMYNTSGIPTTYYKYNYDTNDDLQSLETYGSAYSSTNISYYRQDSTVYTHDGNENPYYNNRSATYFTGNRAFTLSKHNIITRRIIEGTSTQSNNFISFVTTYYKKGQLRTQVYGSGINSDYRTEFLYQQ